MVAAIESDGARSCLIGSRGGRRDEFTVRDTPDTDVARRWLQAVRRVHRVEIWVSNDAVSAVVHGVGHRLPFIRHVPLALALGLAKLGTLTLVRRDHG